MMFKKNDIVMIYFDPITCMQKEGKAVVKEILKANFGPNVIYCTVRFIGDDFDVERRINKEDH